MNIDTFKNTKTISQSYSEFSIKEQRSNGRNLDRHLKRNTN